MTDSKRQYVLDSFAILVLLQNEEGHARIQEVLTIAQKGVAAVTLSVINLGEVLYIVERRQGLNKAQEVLAAVEQLPMRVCLQRRKECSTLRTSKQIIRWHTQTLLLLLRLRN